MKTTEYQTGDRIYYTGDMANIPDEGIIIKRYDRDSYNPISYDIRLDDGRIQKRIWHNHFDNSPGRRFWLLSEWQAEREKQLTAMRERMGVSR
jgi:hypothetical protein